VLGVEWTGSGKELIFLSTQKRLLLDAAQNMTNSRALSDEYQLASQLSENREFFDICGGGGFIIFERRKEVELGTNLRKDSDRNETLASEIYRDCGYVI